MDCYRCHGLMVRDHILDMLDSGTFRPVWRCISCGDIVDPVILANGRRRMRATLAGKKVGVGGEPLAA